MTHTKGRAIRARAKRSQRATHTHTPPTPAAFIAAVPDTAGTPLVVRSFASPITILDGAAITIQRVRQHTCGARRWTPAPRGDHLASATWDARPLYTDAPD